MLYLLIYLVIGVFLTCWFMIGSMEMHREIPRIFKRRGLDYPAACMAIGFVLALGSMIIWLPFLIICIILRIYNEYH